MRITPREGLDDITFGMSRSDVRGLLGEPEQVARDSLGGEDETEAWYYRVRGVSFNFDADCDWRLTTIEVSTVDALLNGRKVIGLAQDALLSVLKSDSVPWADEETHIHAEAWVMNFWIEDGAVSDVQWSVLIGDDDQELWPDTGPTNKPMQTDDASPRR